MRILLESLPALIIAPWPDRAPMLLRLIIIISYGFDATYRAIPNVGFTLHLPRVVPPYVFSDRERKSDREIYENIVPLSRAPCSNVAAIAGAI